MSAIWLYFVLINFSLAISNAEAWNTVNRQTLWINTTYQAIDNQIDIGKLLQCQAWKVWWNMKSNDNISPQQFDLITSRRETQRFTKPWHLKRFGLPTYLLHHNKEVIVNFEEMCQNHSRILWINSTALANRYRLNMKFLCENFMQSVRKVHPAEAVIAGQITSSSSVSISDGPEKSHLQSVDSFSKPLFSDISIYRNGNMASSHPTDHQNSFANVTQSNLIVYDSMTSQILQINIPSALFSRHEAVAFSLDRLCSTSTMFQTYMVDSEQTSRTRMGIDLGLLKFDIQEVVHIIRNDTRIKNMLTFFKDQTMLQPLPATLVLSILEETSYDPRTPPIFSSGQFVDVRVGIHIQSVSNFQLATMDYDMDAWLRMAWRDPRLIHNFAQPILINDERILSKIWRPSPYFANAKHSSFHHVSMMNFYTYIFEGGEVFMEMRVSLKPNCQLILCKYPHDSQTCKLMISSFGFTQDVVKFHWFDNAEDAIKANKKVRLPELYIVGFTNHYCNGVRKSGNFSCLEAQFHMKRTISYHISHTYIPTAMCLFFSWIGVWLPEEFIEGRIFLSLTVFLTLSAESGSTKEILPKVSYIKAIDLWYGFTSAFVFVTMLQSLFVISLQHSTKKIKQRIEDIQHTHGFTPYYKSYKLLQEAARRSSLGRTIDAYCKVLYPLTFLVFLFAYYFVITEGDEDKCVR